MLSTYAYTLAFASFPVRQGVGRRSHDERLRPGGVVPLHLAQPEGHDRMRGRTAPWHIAAACAPALLAVTALFPLLLVLVNSFKDSCRGCPQPAGAAAAAWISRTMRRPGSTASSTRFHQQLHPVLHDDRRRALLFVARRLCAGGQEDPHLAGHHDLFHGRHDGADPAVSLPALLRLCAAPSAGQRGRGRRGARRHQHAAGGLPHAHVLSARAD